MMINLHLLADRASMDIVVDEFSHSGPIVMASHVKERVVYSGMGVNGVVVIES